MAVAMAVDVVIPVHGRYDLTASCLRHLAAQTVRHRVIVVDDGSTDDTPARLRHEWPKAKLVSLGAARGYTHAVNRGVRDGEGEIVILLNNDVELHPHCLERLVAPFADEKLGSVAASLLQPGGELIDSVGVTVDRTLAGFARLQGRPKAVAGAREPVLAGPEGTAGAYRRAAWEAVGGLDETIRAYMEIVDLALRLQAAGWRTVAAPDAVGIHLGSQTYGRRTAGQRCLAGFSRGYLLRRYGVLRRAGPRTLATEAIVVAGDAAINRDLAALRGRLAGWRAGHGAPRHTWPPPAAIDAGITFRESLVLRLSSYRLPTKPG
jgi:N-acetylglucosaminyl-diphospho-decaprenol L-rhamnosyltransferase